MKDISPHNKMNSAETPVTFDFDIVERFPEEICRNVFSYLTFNELLSASLVSKDWYGLIGRAPECMKKLTVINSFESESGDWYFDDIKQTLKNSTRKYRNFQLDLADSRSPVASEVKDILEIRDRKWRKVELSNVCFDTASDLLGVMNNIDRTIVELKIKSVGFCENQEGDNQIESSAMTFPKLKIFKATYDLYQNWIHQIFANCTTLMELQLKYLVSNAEDETVNVAKVHEMLKRNKDLKILNLDAGYPTQFFHTDISEGLQFQLTSLSIECHSFSENQRTNLAKFLRSQLSSLKSLSIRSWIGVEATKMIFHMPNLTSLKLDSFDHNFEKNIDLKTIEFRRNPTISDFNLKVYCAEVDMLRILFPLMPSVKHLELYTVNDEILDVIAANFPDLESLTTYWFTVKDVLEKDILRNLKKITVDPMVGTAGVPLCDHVRKSTSSSFNFARKVDDMREECMENHLNSYVYTGMDNRRVQVRDLIRESKS